MARIDATCIQDVCDSLEKFKRNTGRRYDMATSYKNRLEFCNLYNKLENEIQFLVDTYGCERSSKPYKITLKEFK